MPRIMYVTTAGWLLAAMTQVTAQQPASGPVATVPRSTVARATPRIDPPRILPGTRPNVFSFIQGNALTSTNGALIEAIIRLRNARTGQIVETQVTDQSGLFTFQTVDPGSYIVEIMADDQSSVLAASQILSIGPGEAVSAIVKLPFKIPPFGMLNGTRQSLIALTAQAASTGILVSSPSGAETCATLQP